MLGWASARRVPLLHASDVLIHFEDNRPLLTIGCAAYDLAWRCCPSDPLAIAGVPEVLVVPDEAALLDAMRTSLLDGHVTPMLDALQRSVRLGTVRCSARCLRHRLRHPAGRRRAARRHGANIGTLLEALGMTTWSRSSPTPAASRSVQRRTCCLAFTLPQPKVCSGCCITPT